MRRDRYEYICLESEAGNDAFIRHPLSKEEGLVTGCVKKTDHILATTAKGQKRCWDFHDCEDLHRIKSGSMA